MSAKVSHRLFFGVLLFLGCCLAVRAQEGDEKLRVAVTYDLARPPVPLERIVLRPNTTQAVYFYVSNPGEIPRRNLTMKLVRIAVDGQPFVLQQATVPLLAGGKTTRVNFGKGAPTPKAEAQPKTEVLPPPWPELEGPPFRLEVWLEQEKNPTPQKIKVPVFLMEPRDYVGVGAGMLYDSKENLLRIRVKAAKDFAGPPCPVQLVLSPDLLPGLVATKKGGVFKQFLTKPNQEVELLASDLQFRTGPPRNGRIYLTVDGYERAFMFKTTFAQGILPSLGEENRIRLYAPRHVRPDPKMPLPVALEVDAAPNMACRIELGLDRVGNGQNFDTRLFLGPREQHVFFGPSPQGDLLFKTEIHDWKTAIDTADVFGKRPLRVRMLASFQETEPPQVLPLADEQNQREETLFLFQARGMGLWAPLTFEKNAVLAEVVLDATPPENIQLLDIPSALPQGQARKLLARVKIKKRTEDQAPIKEVKFFFARATPEGKIPEETVDGISSPGLLDVWEADLLVPSDKKDKLDIGVVLTTMTGVKGAASTSILLTVPGKDLTGEDANKLAKISGHVFIGDIPQPNLTVTLMESKNTREAKENAKTTKTDAAGAYVFENVPPGSYTVSAFRTQGSAYVRGATPVQVPKGVEIVNKVDISLLR